MKKGTKKYHVTEKLKALEVGQQFNKKEFITSIWKRTDYFLERSFDVIFNTAKKEFPERNFRTEKGCIVRTK